MNLSETDFLIVITTFIILLCVMMLVMIYGIFIKKKSQLIMAQQRRDAIFEQELAISQVEIKEQTLNYIGQELHDDLGQKLSVARLMTSKISLSKESERQQIMNEVNLLVGECIQDIRNLSKVFITDQVECFGFVESLDREIFRIKKLGFMEVDYKNKLSELNINPNHELILFRMVQECINNTLKHSRAKKITVKINEMQNFLTIRINDNGIGFNADAKDDGSGLKNMKNRAKLINAEFMLWSSEDRGTHITINYLK